MRARGTHAQAFNNQRPVAASAQEEALWHKKKVTLIPEFYEKLFFIGLDLSEGSLPMFDLLYLASLRGVHTTKDNTAVDAGRTTVDAGQTTGDAGRTIDDDGRPPEDAGVGLEGLSGAGGGLEELGASVLDGLALKAQLQEWNRHMTWCNKTLKKEMAELD